MNTSPYPYIYIYTIDKPKLDSDTAHSDRGRGTRGYRFHSPLRDSCLCTASAPRASFGKRMYSTQEYPVAHTDTGQRALLVLLVCDDMLTPTGYRVPPPNTAADMAHSTHSTQPALRPHRAATPAKDKPPQTR